MYQLSDFNRPISEYSDEELKLQKADYRKLSLAAILGIKQVLSDLYQKGIFVRVIKNNEISPCAGIFPQSIILITGKPIVTSSNLLCKHEINVFWDFWRNDVIQHVIESEAL